MIELELTYLAKEIPDDLKNSESKKIIDLYIENGTGHADLRIRKNGDKYEITRKRPVKDGDSSIQEEQTIPINEEEFNVFLTANSKKVEKKRYYYKYEDKTAEFDFFEDNLDGLVLVDFEFETEEEKIKFEMPNFCLKDITQEEFTAGGMLAGKNYSEIKKELDRFNYKKIVK